MKKIKKNRIYLILMLIVIIISIRTLYVNIYKGRTYQVKSTEKYEQTINANALVIKDEYVYVKNGKIDINSEDRIATDSDLGTVDNYINEKGLELDDISDENLKLNDFLENFNKYKYKRNAFENNDIISLRNFIKEKKFNNINTWTNENFTSNKFGLNEIYNSLEKNKISEDVIKRQGENLISMNSGIVSTNIDGYENIYNYYNYGNLTSDILLNDDIVKDNKSTKGLKIIDNSHYILSFTVDNKELSNYYDIGSNIEIKFEDNYLQGKVVGLDINSKNTLISVLFRENFEIIKDLRFINVDLVNYATEIYEIPKKAIVKKDDQQGVYTKVASGEIVFYPIKIVDEDKKLVKVHSGNDGKIILNDKEIETLKLFDNIILNPSAVKEGDLIN